MSDMVVAVTKLLAGERRFSGLKIVLRMVTDWMLLELNADN